MRVISSLIIILLCLTGNHIFAQEIEINARFKGKEIEFRKFIAQNLKYPVLSQEDRSVGYSITSITITPKGEISDISTINFIDKPIEQDINRVLRMTKNKWLKCDTISVDQTFYVQIAYAIGDNQNVENPVKDKYNFVDVVVLTAIGLFNNYLPESDESIATKLAEELKKNNYNKALSYIDESIRRNPFNKESYQLRMTINKKLNRNDLIAKDIQKLQNFIPGVSLDELINKN
jgi:hypothetical protein